MYDDILLPTDGSSGTAEAVDHALGVAGEESTVHALYVVDRRHIVAADEGTKDEIRRSLEEEGERALEEVSVRVTDEGLACETTLTEGIPNSEIVDYAAEAGVDVVVMGTHGQTGPDRKAAMGSTTERVLKDGSTPVLVVSI
jgi:nucleotide-binding universal stress UspA family protein